MKKLIYLLSLISVLISCNDDDSSTVQNLYECYTENEWSVADIKENLVETWFWQYRNCYIDGQNNNDIYNGLTIQFKDDNTLIATQNNQTTTSNWEIIQVDSDFWGIKTTPSIEQLYGRIYICDNQVVFNNSYIDGCDNYFKK